MLFTVISIEKTNKHIQAFFCDISIYNLFQKAKSKPLVCKDEVGWSEYIISFCYWFDCRPEG